MVAEQIAARGIKDARVLRAMENVPRHQFVDLDELAWAYADGPLPIGEGQTISQPYIVALMTELLQVKPQARVLEIGTGSGYQAAVLADMGAEVHTVEIIPSLYKRASQVLGWLGYGSVHTHMADGSEGWMEAAPYDGILLAAAAPQVPDILFNQLKDGSNLVAPVGARGFQWLEV